MLKKCWCDGKYPPPPPAYIVVRHDTCPSPESTEISEYARRVRAAAFYETMITCRQPPAGSVCGVSNMRSRPGLQRYALLPGGLHRTGRRSPPAMS